MRAMGVFRRSIQLIALAVIRTAAITHADQIQTPYTAFHLPPHSAFLRRGVGVGKLLAYTARLRVSTRFSGVMRRLPSHTRLYIVCGHTPTSSAASLTDMASPWSRTHSRTSSSKGGAGLTLRFCIGSLLLNSLIRRNSCPLFIAHDRIRVRKGVKTMDKTNAYRTAQKAVETFRTETNILFSKGASEPATQGDLEELSRQVYYALSSIEAAIEALSK